MVPVVAAGSGGGVTFGSPPSGGGVSGGGIGSLPPAALPVPEAAAYPSPASPEVNAQTGGLAVQAGGPTAGGYDPNPILTYNSAAASTATEVGNGWTHDFKRRVATSGVSNATVVTGTGNDFAYAFDVAGRVFYIPSGPAQNSLQVFGTGFLETRPDGGQYVYNSGGTLLYLRNPSGARWTMAYDGGGRPLSIANPFGRRASFAYDANNHLKRLQDAGGRITSFTVDATGNLTQTTTPELCQTGFGYDGSHRMTARVNPLGDRTTYLYASGSGGGGQLVAAHLPLGQRVSFVYSSGRTAVLDPRGHRATLSFAAGLLRSAVDAAGVRTSYVYDASNRLTAFADGRGNRTTYAYTALGNKMGMLSSATAPLGERSSTATTPTTGCRRRSTSWGIARAWCGTATATGRRSSTRRGSGRATSTARKVRSRR